MEEKILYKYKRLDGDIFSNDTPFAYTMDSLRKKYFYFSTPEQLNDDEDSITPIQYLPDNDKQILEWLLSFKKASHYTNSEFSEFPYNTVAKIKESILSNGFFKNAIDESFRLTAKNYHVLSLTDSNQNMYMWKHKDYCNDFQGICIGYRSYKLFSSQQDYYLSLKGISNSERKNFFLCLDNHFYAITTQLGYKNDRKHTYNFFEEKLLNQHMKDTFSLNRENIIYNLFNKTDRWKNEREIRAFFCDSYNTDSRVFYAEKTLASITFGYNVSSEKKQTIIDLVNSEYKNEKIELYEINITNNAANIISI